MKNLFLICFALVCAKQLSAQSDQIKFYGSERSITQFELNEDESILYGIGTNFDVVNQEKSLRTYLFVWNVKNGELIGKKNLTDLTKQVVINGILCKGNLGQVKLDIPNNRLMILGDQYQKLLPDGTTVYYNGVIHVLSLDPAVESVKTYVIPNELKASSIAINPANQNEVSLTGTIKNRQIIANYPLDTFTDMKILFDQVQDFKSTSYPFFTAAPLTYSEDGNYLYACFGLKGVKGGMMRYNLKDGTSKKVLTNFVPHKIKFIEEEIIITTKDKLTLIFDINTLAQKKSYPAKYYAISTDKKFALEGNSENYLVNLKNLIQGSTKVFADFRVIDAEFSASGNKIIISRLKGYMETLEEDQQNPSIYLFNFEP